MCCCNFLLKANGMATAMLRRVAWVPGACGRFFFGGKQTSEQAKLKRRQQGKSKAKRIQCNENGNIIVSAFRLKRLYQIRLFPQCWQSPAMTSCYPEPMVRALGENARSNAVNDSARVPMVCLCRHLPRSEGARLERNRCHSCRHGHAKQIVTLRCGGALSSVYCLT